MVKEKKIPVGGLNADDDPRYLKEDEYLNLENCRVSTGVDSKDLRIENIYGTIIKYNGYPGINNAEIGWVVDEENQWLVWFNFGNTEFDAERSGIYCYDQKADTTYIVLLSTDVTGGLNFATNHRIHSARIIDGMLYWCNDNLNELRKIDIKAGINLYRPGIFPAVPAYTSPLSQSVISMAKRQPGLPPSFVKVTQSSPVLVNNFIALEAFQFMYQYVYKNFETCTLSGRSTTANYNISTDTFNRINVTIPLLEKIDQDVIKINLIASYFNSNTFFVINTWDKNVSADAAAIIAHNAGTPLVYPFYNNKRGTTIDNIYASKPFDSIPINGQTLEIERNRAHIGNYTIGYDTPTITSLTAIPNNKTSGSVIGQWIVASFFSPTFTLLGSHYYIYILGHGYYDITPQPSTHPPWPTTEDFVTNLTFVAIDDAAAFNAYLNTIKPPLSTVGVFFGFNTDGSIATATITTAPFGPGVGAGTRVLKTDASYQVSIDFKDNIGRKCGYLTNNSLIINNPDRLYVSDNFSVGVAWLLNNLNALLEIPVWAFYYSINITKCLRTRFFIQMRGTKGATTAFKDSSGVWQYTGSPPAGTPLNDAWDITSLLQYNLGYVFTEGDILKVWLNDGNPAHQLAIVAQDGNWLITELGIFGLGPTTAFLFEIYTPYKALTNEPAFEVQQLYPILNPGSSTRAYSVTGGQIGGDVTLLQRNDGVGNYLVEAMSPNDKFPFMWNTDAGRSNFIDTLGQVTKRNTIAFSNTIIEGTRINGLSTFDPADTKDLPEEAGQIQKLQRTSKIANEPGNVMLAICEFETASLYMGESRLTSPSTQGPVTTVPDVIGTINFLKGSNGTINPESVFELYGQVFWMDVFNGGPVQYSTNGLFMFSNFKMKSFFRKYCKRYIEHGKDQITAINGFSHISICIDPASDRLLITLPATEVPGYCGILPGYSGVPSYTTSIDNRYDFYDGKAKTVAYKYKQERWGEAYEYVSEGLANLGTNLYGFKTAALYKHNSDAVNFNNIYGVNYPQRICLVFNQNMDIIREMETLGIEANNVPNFVHLLAEYPNIQSSDLTVEDFVTREGVHYAAVLRDRLSPNTPGTADEKMYRGDKIRSAAPKIMIEFSVFDNKLEINFINAGYRVSSGHAPVLTTK